MSRGLYWEGEELGFRPEATTVVAPLTVAALAMHKEELAAVDIVQRKLRNGLLVIVRDNQ
jgi:hypothetical protein